MSHDVIEVQVRVVAIPDSGTSLWEVSTPRIDFAWWLVSAQLCDGHHAAAQLANTFIAP
jgi:hypothetical protein